MTYPDAGFEQCYKAYPHWEQRSNKKISFEVWTRLGLTPEVVLPWIKHGLAGQDWARDGGKYVKGFQSWLRKTDFSEPPPSAEPEWDKANEPNPHHLEELRELAIQEARRKNLIDPSKYLYESTVRLVAYDLARQGNLPAERDKAVQAILEAAVARSEWLSEWSENQ